MADKDFTFIVGENEYRCSKFQAGYISPNVCKLMNSDPTTTSFRVGDITDENRLFEGIIDLMNGRDVEINDKNIDFMKAVSQILGNDELDELLVSFEIGRDSISDANIIERINLKQPYRMDTSTEISYIASHWYNLDAEVRKSLNYNELEMVLSDKNLKIASEDSLLEFLVSLGEDFRSLLRYVEVQYLSARGINSFLQIVSPSELDAGIWESICRRLRIEVSNAPDSNRIHRKVARPKGTTIEYNGDGFNGILSHLKSTCGGNVHDKGIVVITASSEGNSKVKCHQVADGLTGPDANYDWFSSGEKSGWIRFDFKDRRVSLSHYTLKSGSSHFLVSWKVEGSDDGIIWREIGSESCRAIASKESWKTFSTRDQTAFRYIRISSTDFNGDISICQCLTLRQVEFFGTLHLWL